MERATQGRAGAVSATLSCRAGFATSGARNAGPEELDEQYVNAEQTVDDFHLSTLFCNDDFESDRIASVDEYPNVVSERDRDIARSTPSVGGVRRSSPPVIEQALVDIENVRASMVKSGGTGRMVGNSVEQTVGFECSTASAGLGQSTVAAPPRGVSCKDVGGSSEFAGKRGTRWSLRRL
jgi:hypothetical protein